jgi:glycosyltransferase involved in cell wall biosynthesis
MAWPVLLLARELDLGGSERQMTEIAKTLDRSRFTPHVGCFRPQGMRGAELAAAGVPVVSFRVNSFASYSAVREAGRLRAYIRRHGIRLVHTFDYPLTLFAVPVARCFTNAVVLSSQRSHRDLIPSRYRQLIGLTDSMAHAIVVNCEFVQRHLGMDERIPAERMRLCYNGVDLERFKPMPRSHRPITIGTVSALRPEKDVGTLIEAFALLRRTDVKLSIVGAGAMLAPLRALAAARNLPVDEVFSRATPDAAEALGKIDIFVLPSRSEALSNSLLEAMACGCCPVVSRVGGNPELVNHDENGRLFEGGDVAGLGRVLEELVNSPALCRWLGSRARCTAERFSIRAAARRMEEIYTEFLEGLTR